MDDEGSCDAAIAATPPSCRRDLGYQLGILLREYQRRSVEVFADIPGGQRGFQVLLAAGEGGGPNQASIAGLLGLDRTVMTYLLDELVDAGLVERRPDPADRRARKIMLTEAGSATLTKLGDRLRQLERSLLGALGDAEYEQFGALLARAGELTQPAFTQPA